MAHTIPPTHDNLHRRQLLDTEKIIFYTDDEGTFQVSKHVRFAEAVAANASCGCSQGKKPIVEMQAEATGIHRDGPAAKPKYLLFNIGLS